MRPSSYAEAIRQLAERGEKPKTAVARVFDALKARGRLALAPHIAREFVKLAARDAQKKGATLKIAREKDEKRARKESEAGGATVVLDPSLIGGWRLESGETLVDASWKKYLLSLYNLATRS